MDKERLEKLESIYVQMNFAYNQRNENTMKASIIEFHRCFPDKRQDEDCNIRKVFSEHNETICFPCPIYSIFGDILSYNIEGCLRTIESIFEENKYQTFSPRCIEVLYFPQKAFTPTDVLYTTSRQNNNSENSSTLKVSDLLSVAKYSLQVLEIIQPNEKTSDVSDAITVMQSIDLALNNKPYDKPLNKSLHIANSALTSFVKRNLENESDKRFVSTMGLLIDLAIDFFTAKK